MSAGTYRAETAEMAAVVEAVEDVGSAFRSATRDLEGLVLDALSFAGIGSAVAAANSALHSSLAGALQKLLDLVTNVNQNVRTAAEGYRAADSDVAQAYGGGQGGGAAAAAAAPRQLDPRVVDSIMRSEGATGEQGGVPEAYGFRQNMHNGYDRIIAARERYGIGSAEERAVVADLMTANARTAGALEFTDPGTQAAIMSGAHMRGAGGVRAILNHLAGDDIVRSSRTLGDAAIQHVQGLTPEQFQQEFRDARIEYDRRIYGGTTTTQGGHTQNWWDRYGTGLTRRYDREQTEFLGLSRPPE
ncbi:hypothetical protein AB0F15_24785 [Amycolatopsis sp. NPDC026612]|uniref:hypothetical protein n=1 Tax=Amycolatopsis sp. NPDC026612 TaxID=3155466 RepID=UPI0033C0A4DF